MASKFPPENQASQQETPGQETLLEFPCKFSVKAMGRGETGFDALVTDIVLSHAELYVGEQVMIKPSETGKYISVSVTIEALSKDQLDRIYQDLTDCEQVLVAL